MEIETFFESNEKKKKAIGLIHKIYLNQIKNARQYNAFTKTKSEVRGGGKKPWKQKGTGNARAGSRRSPLWVGGGVSFGPKPRVVNKKSNKKERRLAILAAFYLKKTEFLFVEEDFFTSFDKIKTKNIVEFLKTLKNPINPESRILFILNEPNRKFWLTTRNIKNIEVTTANCLNVKQLLNTNHIILSNLSFNSVNLTYGKSDT